MGGDADGPRNLLIARHRAQRQARATAVEEPAQRRDGRGGDRGGGELVDGGRQADQRRGGGAPGPSGAVAMLSTAAGKPPRKRGAVGNGDTIRSGSPANTTVAAPRMKMPTPIVTMISESSERWNSGRRTIRLKRSASP